MACPYFCPTQALPWSVWEGKLRPPLGQVFEGECRARAGQPFQPQGVLLRDVCNFGYAGAECERFPAAEGADAVRFALESDQDSSIRIQFVFEKAHLPFRHGALTYDRGTRAWSGLEEDSLLQRQAEAYLNSYLTWKAETAAARPARAGSTG